MPPSSSSEDESDNYEDEILSRFIVDKKDTIVGESIGIEGKFIVVKHREKFYLVPRNAVKLQGDKLVLKKKVDWIAALARGEGWRKEELDHLWGKPLKQTKKKTVKKVAKTSDEKVAKKTEKEAEKKTTEKKSSGKKSTKKSSKTKGD